MVFHNLLFWLRKNWMKFFWKKGSKWSRAPWSEVTRTDFSHIWPNFGWFQFFIIIYNHINISKKLMGARRKKFCILSACKEKEKLYCFFKFNLAVNSLSKFSQFLERQDKNLVYNTIFLSFSIRKSRKKLFAES